MKRRDFLKGIAAVPAIAIVGLSKASTEIQFGKTDNFKYYPNHPVRVIQEYDSYWDVISYRYDLTDRKIRLSVQVRSPVDETYPHDPAMDQLRRDALLEGMDLSQLEYLPMPKGMKGEYLSL